MKYILKYTRGAELKFISHLDTIRVFERAFRRANLPVAFSEGFNPHPKFSIALPLALGHESLGELMELTLTQDLAPAEIKLKLNEVLPEGLKITEVKEYQDQRSLMSRVTGVVYQVLLNYPEEFLYHKKEILLKQNPQILKKTKRGEKLVEFWQAVLDLEVITGGIRVVINLGENSLRPEEIVKVFLGELPEEASYLREKIILS